MLLGSILILLSRLPAPGTVSASRASEQDIHSIPLVPHHVLLFRRRRELRSFGLSEVQIEEKLSVNKASKYLNQKKNGNKHPLRRRMDVGDYQVNRMFQGYGTHYVDLWVGTPPQRQTVIVDTGSEIVAFPCSSCKKCGRSHHTDPPYNEERSSTFKKLSCGECKKGECKKSGENGKCDMHQSYAEGSSWDAYEAVDIAYPGGLSDKRVSIKSNNEINGNLEPKSADFSAFNLTFGCQSKVSGLFLTQLADGVLGMANKKPSFWSQMSHKKNISSQFSLCFTRKPSVSSEGTTAGAITFGGSDPLFHSSPMMYAENPKPKGYWHLVHVQKIYLRRGGGETATIGQDDILHALDVDEASINPPGGGVILDSGSTQTILNHQIGRAFKAKWKEVSGFDFTNDWVKLTKKQRLSLPTIMFQLRASKNGANDIIEMDRSNNSTHTTDVVVAMPASHYLDYDPIEDRYSCGIVIMNGENDWSTLGANFMEGHDILFDVENGRIGIAESDCDYASLTTTRHKKDSSVMGTIDKPLNFFSRLTNSWGQRIRFFFVQINPKHSSDDDLCFTPECKCKFSAVIVVVIIAIFILLRGCLSNRHRGFKTVPTCDDQKYDQQEEKISCKFSPYIDSYTHHMRSKMHNLSRRSSMKERVQSNCYAYPC